MVSLHFMARQRPSASPVIHAILPTQTVSPLTCPALQCRWSPSFEPCNPSLMCVVWCDERRRWSVASYHSPGVSGPPWGWKPTRPETQKKAPGHDAVRPRPIGDLKISLVAEGSTPGLHIKKEVAYFQKSVYLSICLLSSLHSLFGFIRRNAVRRDRRETTIFGHCIQMST